MLKFDSNHEKINKKIQKQTGKKFKNMLILGVIISSITILSACNCEMGIEGDHVHRYISNTGFTLNVPACYSSEQIVFENYSENESDWVYFKKTQDYECVTEDEYDLYELLYDNNLISIEENQEALEQYLLSANIAPFLQYEYSYNKILPGINGGSFVTTRTDWTSDSNHPNLTGNQRICYPVYYGYNISKDEDGEYVLDKSKPYNSYEELKKDGYQYISFYLNDFINFSLNYDETPENTHDGGLVK